MDKRKEIVMLLHKHMFIWAVIGFIFGILPWPEHLHRAMPLIMFALAFLNSPMLKLMWNKHKNGEMDDKSASAISNIPSFMALSACGLAAWISIFITSDGKLGFMPLIFVVVAFFITFIKYKFVRSILDDYPI